MICASTGAFAISTFERQQNLAKNEKFASQLVENDYLGEFYLIELISKVQSDQIIVNTFAQTRSNLEEFVTNKLRRIYLIPYFDKYDSRIHLFNEKGISYTENLSYDSIKLTLTQKQFMTDNPNIFFINDVAKGSKRYISLIPLTKNDRHVGHIMLDLNLKKIIPNSIHPFFIASDFNILTNESSYGYAIYSKGDLIYSFGDFNYSASFFDLFKTDLGFLKKEIQSGEYHHLRKSIDLQYTHCRFFEEVPVGLLVCQLFSVISFCWYFLYSSSFL